MPGVSITHLQQYNPSQFVPTEFQIRRICWPNLLIPFSFEKRQQKQLHRQQNLTIISIAVLHGITHLLSHTMMATMDVNAISCRTL
jgi:hypothetical protein